jgi:hypothetical protein
MNSKLLISLLTILSTLSVLGQENEYSSNFEKKYENAYNHYLDTTSLFSDKDTLTLLDSLKLKSAFDKVYFDTLLKDLKSERDSIKTDFSFDSPNTSVGIAYDWDQLEKSDQELIANASKKYLKKLVDNDVQGFWELCHSKFKESTPLVSFNEVGTLISNMITSMDSLEFVDGKKIVYTTPPKISQFSTGGSLDKSNPTYLQFYTLAGIENQALSLYKLKKSPLSKTITMKFGLEDSEYKLTSFEINTSSIGDKQADYYSELAEKWESDNSQLPKFIAINLAYRLSYLGRGTSTSKMIDITEEVMKLQKNQELILEIKKWDINGESFDIINIDFLETQNDITPNILYVSNKNLGKKPTTKEVEILFAYFTEKYPDLVNEFEKFMFTAYEEYPAIPTKEYQLYRVIMDVNEKK